MALIFTFSLPIISTACPGPWPWTSADGENTRRYSQGSRNDVPSSQPTSRTRDLRCRRMAEGVGMSALMAPPDDGTYEYCTTVRSEDVARQVLVGRQLTEGLIHVARIDGHLSARL